MDWNIFLQNNPPASMLEASPSAVSRLKKDFQTLLQDPLPNITAFPSDSNILEWHYLLKGAPQTPYEGGYYHGKLIFPPDFPFKPPAIYMLTPSGRFEINTRLCFSMSDYHPDTWSPAWSISTILTGLHSFMNDTADTFGSIQTTDEEKRAYARKSRAYNAKNPEFIKIFGEDAQGDTPITEDETNKPEAVRDENNEVEEPEPPKKMKLDAEGTEAPVKLNEEEEKEQEASEISGPDESDSEPGNDK